MAEPSETAMPDAQTVETVLILGSGPTVTAARDWPRAPFDHVLAINNAWAIRPDWDAHIAPFDFPDARMPPPDARTRIGEADFVPANNAYGGFVYAGATMAFTAAYWALHALRPKVIAMMGCDMHYPPGRSHFYGIGTPDPLRPDITLQSLEAKSARLAVMAARQDCAMVNLSHGPTRLTFPQVRWETLRRQGPRDFDEAAARRAEGREGDLGYACPSGRYWEEPAGRYDPAELDALDALWLACTESRIALRA